MHLKTGHIYSSSFSTTGERSQQGVNLWTVGAHLFSRGSDGQRCLGRVGSFLAFFFSAGGFLGRGVFPIDLVERLPDPEVTLVGPRTLGEE